MEKLNTYIKDQYVTVSDWLKFAESKLGVLLSLNIAVISVIATSIKDINTSIHFFYKFSIVISSISFVLSLFLCLYGLISRTNEVKKMKFKDKRKRETYSITFFKEIAHQTFEQYIDNIGNKLDCKDSKGGLQNDLLIQIHEISVLASNKFYLLNISAYIFGTGSIVLCISWLIYTISYVF
ncbi:Pycsar system effector family protein [Lewinella cohaerens]|uniref:Pycsar system effector family protein n=1 Tax=Lewinella cohaerens TaxID=70995 RepID=UPI0012EC59E0|nr:Pycsar system effector family protein [Lewinella cohaerens]